MGSATFDLSGDPLVIAGEEFPRVIRDTRALPDGRALTVEYSPGQVTLTAELREGDVNVLLALGRDHG
jgi:hypothetical protein